MRSLVLFGLAAIAGSAVARTVDCTVSGSVTLGDLTEDTVVNVAEGVSVTNASAVAGSGKLVKTGKGKFVIPQANGYTGGTAVQQGQLVVLAGGALGSGDVRVDGSTSESCGIVFGPMSAAATFANAFTVGQSNSTYPAFQFMFSKKKSITFTGSFAVEADLYMIDENANYGGDSHLLVFDCPFSVPNGTLFHKTSVGTEWKKPVVTPVFEAQSGWAWTGRHYFFSPENRIGKLIVSYDSVQCKAANVCDGAVLVFGNNKETSSRGFFNTGAYPQRLAYMTSAMPYTKGIGFQDWDVVTTITLTGGVAKASCASVLNQSDYRSSLSLVVDDAGEAGDFVQEFYGPGVHYTHGSLIARRGTLRFADTTAFPYVQSIQVGTGGTFDLATAATNACVGVTNVSVAAGGTFRVGPDAVTPFRADSSVRLTLSVASTSVLDLPAGTDLAVYRFTVDGQAIRDGAHTHADCAVIPEGVTIRVTAVEPRFVYTTSGNIDLGAEEGDLDVSVSAGVTVTNVGEIAGNRRIAKSGPGTLVLAQANTYSGGTRIVEGTLQVTDGAALGSGDVWVAGSDQQTCRIMFGPFAQAATIPNNVTFAYKSSSAYPAAYFWTIGTKSMSFTGDWTAQSALYLSDPANVNAQNSWIVSFRGAFDAGENEVTYPTDNQTVWVGPITAKAFHAHTGYPRMGAHHLYNPQNSVGLFDFSYTSLYLEGTNVFAGAVLNFSANNTEGYSRGCVRFNGYSQTAAAVTSPVKSYLKNLGYNDSKPAVLTLTGSDDDALAYCCVGANDGKNLSLVLDSGREDFVQTFRGNTNYIAGTCTVRRGTLRFDGASLLRNVPQVTVTGGTFDLASTVEEAMSGVTNVTVGADGTFACAATAMDPFGADPAAVLHLSGRLDLPSGTVMTVRRLYLNGEYMPAEDYTGEGGAGKALEQISGTGVLRVLNGRKGLWVIIR